MMKNMKINQRLAVILGLCFILGFGAIFMPKCKTDHNPLRVATSLWPGYELLYLARTLGYYDNLPIRLVEVPSTSVISRNLRNGTLEAGCITLDEALMLIQDEVDIRIILVIDESRGGDMLLGKPSVKSLQDLRGKRIGFENSTVTAILLDAALTEAKIPISEIKQVELTIDQHYNGYMDDKVDAIATFEPVASKLLKQNANLLFSSAQIPERIIDVLVVRADIMDTYSDELTALLNGYFRALEYFNHHPSDASKYMERRLGTNPLNQFKGLHFPAVNENYRYLKGDSAQIIESSEILMKLMLKQKLLRHQLSYKNLADPRFLPNE
jgi:NitT/TauT family transport system substrate-binding protein